MNTTIEEPAQIAELELVVAGTNELSVQDEALREITETLRPIAEAMPEAIAYSKTVKVTNEAEAKQAADHREQMLKMSKTAKETIDGFGDGLIGKLHKLHRRWTGFRGLFDPLEDAARKTKQAIIAWQEAEAEKARQEQRRLQALADEQARKERERLEKEAEKLKTPEKKVERLEAAAAVAAPVVTVATPTAAVKSQKRWKVKSVDLTAMGIPAEVQGFIEVKISNLERAKAANTMLTVPGVEFHQVTI